MDISFYPTMSLPIPDLRFESTFRRQLEAKAQGQEITWKVWLSVILKEVFMMPLIQSVIYSSALMFIKPWLNTMKKSGYNASSWLISQFKTAVRYDYK